MWWPFDDLSRTMQTQDPVVVVTDGNRELAFAINPDLPAEYHVAMFRDGLRGEDLSGFRVEVENETEQARAVAEGVRSFIGRAMSDPYHLQSITARRVREGGFAPVDPAAAVTSVLVHPEMARDEVRFRFEPLADGTARLHVQPQLEARALDLVLGPDRRTPCMPTVAEVEQVLNHTVLAAAVLMT